VREHSLRFFRIARFCSFASNDCSRGRHRKCLNRSSRWLLGASRSLWHTHFRSEVHDGRHCMQIRLFSRKKV